MVKRPNRSRLSNAFPTISTEKKREMIAEKVKDLSEEYLNALLLLFGYREEKPKEDGK